MWVLEFLPDWTFYLVLLIGIVGYLITYLLRFVPIPALFIYKTPIQIISVAMIVIGTFMIGAEYNDSAWKEKVSALEKKVAEAEARAAQENVKIVEKVVTKTMFVKEKAQTNTQYIDREIVKYNNICEIPKEFIKVHNSAAEPPK